MISNACVFLTLLIPLLVHGAPTPNPPDGNQPTGFDWLPKNHQLVNNVLPPPMPRPWPGYPHAQPIQGPQGTNPHVQSVQGPQGTNLHAQPMDFTNANWPPHTMPPAGLPNTNPAHLTYDELKINCKFPRGAIYRVPPWPTNYQLQKVTRTRQDRVVIAKGKIFLVPKGSNIEISNDDTIDVPSGNTKIREVNENDVARVKEFCEGYYIEESPKRLGLEPKMGYVLRCSDINYWNIGVRDFEKVPVEYITEDIILPPGTMYRQPPARGMRKFRPSRPCTKENRFALTRNGHVIYVPANTAVRISDDPASDNFNRIKMSTHKTEIRIIDREDVEAIKENCKDDYDQAKPPSGLRRPSVRGYMTRCSDENFKNFGNGFIHVAVEFVKKPR